MTIRELEIIKAALEYDIHHQRKSLEYLKGQESYIDFVEWLDDTEKLLAKISLKLMRALATDEGVEYLKSN